MREDNTLKKQEEGYLNLPELIHGYKNHVQKHFQGQPWFSEEKEAEVLEQMEKFFSSEKEPFKRTCLKGHFTASCLLVNSKTKKFVLTHHKKLGLWLQLGGHCDGEENLVSVALKEAEEESGLSHLSLVNHLPIDFDIHVIPASKKDPEHLHLDVRFLIETRDEDLKISDESLDLKWFSEKEARLLTKEESLLRLVSKREHLKKISP